MCGFRPGRLVLALLCVFILSSLSHSADQAALVSTMRNVNAVMEAQGFRINPAFDHSGFTIEGDLAPVQAFEIIRPDGKAFSIGRLYTSCTCIQLESPKKSFADGERAILQLRNIKPTPVNGQIYAIYVQITSPVRTTLRFDTFVQSNNPVLMAAAEGAEEAGAPAAPAAADDVEEFAPPPAVTIADAPQPAPAASQPQSSTGQGFQVIVPGVEPDQPEVAAVDEPAEPEQPSARPAAPDTSETPAEPADIISQFDAIAAEAEARVQAASAAANSMASDMDDYFAEMDSAMPEALPPPAEAETLPPAPTVSPAPAAAAGTRLEEAVNTASAAPTAPVQDDIAPVSGKKPLKNISLITIGVSDLDRSIRFYRALGWEMAPRGKYDQTAFFQLNGQVLVLYPMPELLREQNMESAKPSPGGITLAIHVNNGEEVVETYKTFIEAGGIPLKEPTETLAGSVTGYVADPDGNAWEISYVSQFKIDANGWLWLNQK